MNATEIYNELESELQCMGFTELRMIACFDYNLDICNKTKQELIDEMVLFELNTYLR